MAALNFTNTKSSVYDYISPSHALKDTAKGKKIIVTGAGTGVGKVRAWSRFRVGQRLTWTLQNIAETFATAGAKSLVLAGRRLAHLETTKTRILAINPSCEVICVVADIVNLESVQNLFEKAGKADVLVNNAGFDGKIGDMLKDSDPEDYWKVYDVNLKGTYLTTRSYLQSLSGGPGCIINIGSTASLMTAPTLSAYLVSKSALARLSELTALENAAQGVTCFCLHPGAIPDTDMTNRAPDQFKAYLIDTADLAGGTVLLLSTGKFDFMSGRWMNGTWDMQELLTKKDEIVKDNLLVTRPTGIAYWKVQESQN